MESASYEIKLKDSFSSGLGGIENKMNRFEGKVGGLKDSFGGLGSSIAGAFAGGLVAGGISSLVSGLKDIGIEVIKVTREFTNLQDAISFASGDQAGKNLEFLDRTIDRLGLDMKSTYAGFKTFQGALMGTALEGDEGRRIFESVSKASSVMKLSADNTEGAFLALGQMISKGTVSAEELRQQLGERLPGAFQIAARAMGVTTDKLGDMMKAGQLGAEEFLPKFATELEKTFNPGVLKAQDSFNANWNRFNNFILRSKISLGNSLLPLLNDIVKIIPKLDFSPIVDNFKELFYVGGFVRDIFNDLMNVFGVTVTGISGFQSVVQGLAIALRVSMTPLRLLAGTFQVLYQTIKASALAMYEFGMANKNLATGNFKGAFENIKNIGSIAGGLGTTFKGVLTKEAEGWAKLFSGNSNSSKENDSASSYASGSKNRSSISGTSGKAAGIERIQAGTRSVTVNISKLIEKVTFEKGYKESEAKLQEMITKALLTSVNDVNIVSQ